MEKTLFKFVWKYSWRQQSAILLITFLSFPLLYMMLELPKMIINEAIGGTNFPRSFLGASLGQIEYLLSLCTTFLILVILNNGVKFTLNVYKGLTAERMLRRLRYDLYQRILRFRLPHFRKVSSGEIIPMITAEVEPIGGYVGDAIAAPAFQGGTLLVYITFIFMQDFFLGLAAIALYPLQGYLIPKLQMQVNLLNRERIKAVRKLSEKINESMTGVTEIHSNAMGAWHLADISDRLYKIFSIRYKIFNRKYGIKFLNNFINQLTPFAFYLIGGYLVIKGQITFGALVAVLAAYKDLAGPWKELLNHYQLLADTRIKYQTVIENFDLSDLYPVKHIIGNVKDDNLSFLDGPIEVESVTYASGAVGQELTDVSVKIMPGSHTVVLGEDGSGRSELLQIIAGLISPDAGYVEIGTRNIALEPEIVLGRSIAYIGANPYLFSDTIRANLLYGVRQRPIMETSKAEADPEERRRLFEAKATDNSLFNIFDEWDNISAAGVKTMDELDEKILQILIGIGLGDDIYHMGLEAHIDPLKDPALADAILKARGKVRSFIENNPEISEFIEFWDINVLNQSATLAQNVLFAIPANQNMKIVDLAHDPVCKAFFQKSELDSLFIEMGLSIAETMVSLFANVKDASSALAAFSFIRQDDFPIYERLVNQSKTKNKGKFSAKDQALLIGLALQLIPSKHRLGIINSEVEARIIAARKVFQQGLLAEERKNFVFFDADNYLSSLSIGDNLLMGRPRVDRRGSREKVDQIIANIVETVGLRSMISRAGLNFHVGVGGARLAAGQRRRIALARALLKHPQILILDDVIDPSGFTNQKIVATITHEMQKHTIIYGIPRLENAEFKDLGHENENNFDHIIIMKGGRLETEGSHSALAAILNHKM